MTQRHILRGVSLIMAEVLACSVDSDVQVSRNSSHFWDQKPNKRS
ncbi:hypothetical protein SLEP1_g53705 [Rubroshorea leprosula]|uniref:Uncharacterized protein n=1 Tax=Rubroshorea leprosula TaxID=152421 RepID=A0AAV5MAC3_9ROSI|nr:hypothetical protein SLEP1_g53705 [Rubroshorea leprosula]